jgi:hypothetical protein
MQRPSNRRRSGSRFCRPRVEWLEDRLAPAGLVVAGAGAGERPEVRVFDAQTGVRRAEFLAYGPHFRGGVRVAVGDVTGDGVPDIVTAAGPGGAPRVEVFNGRDLSLVAGFDAYAPTFRGGVNVAVGDVNHDGIGDIITGSGPGGPPRVRVFDVVNGRPAPVAGPLGDFLAYGPNVRGGVTVAAGNVDGRPGDELITAAGPGAAAPVKVFGEDGRIQTRFAPYGPHFRGGVSVAAGDVNDDGHADVVTGAGAGRAPVKVFSGADASLLDNFFAFGPSSRGGVRVAAADVNGDGHADILAASGPGRASQQRVLDGRTLTPITSLAGFAPGSRGGSFGAAAGLDSCGDPNSFQVQPEAPVLSRLARFIPNAVPSLSNWTAVSTADPNLDPATDGGKSHVYVIAHGWAPGFETMVQDNGTPADPLKWWQTLDTSLMGSPGAPASADMFYGASGDGIQISPSGLAYAITQADPKAVVLAYSWIDNSATDEFLSTVPECAFVSEAYTALNGTRLADALESALPATFHADGGALHLIGHSHGAKVATVAADVLTQTHNTNFAVAHLTLLDSPETSSSLVSVADAANNLWYFLGALDIGRSPGQTFVDNTISEFDNPIGPIQGVNPFNTSQTTPVLQQVVDVNLNGGVLFSSLDPFELSDLHDYAFAWYAGGSLAWAQNPTPNVADQWSPLLNPSTPPGLAGSYTQSWAAANQPQFVLTPGPQRNTVTDTPAFTNLSFLSTSVTGGASYTPSTGALVLNDSGGAATFTGKFSPESGLAGISFNYQFTHPGAGDQLVISVDTGALFGYQIHYVMTGSVAGMNPGFGTLSLTSLAHSFFNHDVQIQLLPAAGGSGTASVTITNMQQFTS